MVTCQPAGVGVANHNSTRVTVFAVPIKAEEGIGRGQVAKHLGFTGVRSILALATVPVLHLSTLKTLVLRALWVAHQAGVRRNLGRRC
jgi:hypothetical protein